MLQFKSRMVRAALVFISSALIALMPLGIAYAANPSGTGQPNVDCAEAGAVPGHSDTAPGSAFNEEGKAGTVYAGEQPQNSINSHSVSQYDVACFKVP